MQEINDYFLFMAEMGCIYVFDGEEEWLIFPNYMLN